MAIPVQLLGLLLLAVQGLPALSTLRSSGPAGPDAGCPASWLPTLGGQPGTNGRIYSAAMFDSGTGPELYIGGAFSIAGGSAAAAIARWDGSSWSEVGGGSTSTVGELLVHDDGAGPALFASGYFTTSGGTAIAGIGKWDGQSWQSLGSGILTGGVGSLTTHTTGGVEQLYVGGGFDTAGGVPAHHIARWDGTQWFALGSGLDNTPWALCSFDDGSGAGAELFAAGTFLDAGGLLAKRVAKWDGTSWSSVGLGMNDVVYALEVFDAGAGPRLYAGGIFSMAGGNSANRLASWDGSTWSAAPGALTGDIQALASFDDGSGSKLYLGNDEGVVRWDGTATTVPGSGVQGLPPSVYALVEFDDGSGAPPTLCAAGDFMIAGGLGANRIATWDGAGWSNFGEGLDNAVWALESHDDGSGPALFVGGDLLSAGGALARFIAKWDGAGWSPLGSGVNGSVRVLESFDDATGGGPQLYAGGSFTAAGGATARSIAKWDGVSWQPLGSGAGFVTTIEALAVWDDGSGSGPALHVGGDFTSLDGVPASRIARWDGTTWSALGAGLVNTVRALAVFDDGGGPALFAAGKFTTAGGLPARRIAKWDGTNWTALGLGLGGGEAYALGVYDDGGGDALYVGGSFGKAGGSPAVGIARWGGTNWSAVGAVSPPSVRALSVFDDGSGSALFAGGRFTTAGGIVPMSYVGRWDGASWTPLASGLSYYARALEVHTAGAQTSLYVGGEFASAPDSGDSFLARWGGCSNIETFCSAGTSASGCAPTVTGSGTPSASAASGFTVLASNVEGSKDGLFYFGANGRQANSWGNGTSLQCVVPPVQRASLLSGTGTNGACDGSMMQDLNTLWSAQPGKNPGAGAVVQAQLWYRDPQNTSNQTTSLSDAIEFTVGP